jgi:hypothetical protein
LAEPEENEGSPVVASCDTRLVGRDLLEERNSFSMFENPHHFAMNGWPVINKPFQKRIASIIVNRHIGNERLAREKLTQTPSKFFPEPLNALAPRFSEALIYRKLIRHHLPPVRKKR